MITETVKLESVSLALVGVAGASQGTRPLAIVSLANASTLSASMLDVSPAAMTTAVVKVRVGLSKDGPWYAVPSGCIGTGGTDTMTVSAPLAGPVDVRAFSHAALEVTTAEAAKLADLTIIAKGQTE